MPTIPGPNGDPLWIEEIAEKIAGVSPNGSSFSLDGNSSATMTFIIDSIGLDSNGFGTLTLFCNQVLGTSFINLDDEENPVNGALVRFAPMAHPQWGWLYANRITSVRGIGPKRSIPEEPASELARWNTMSSASLQLTAPYFAVYSKYEVTVEFSPLKYRALSDVMMDALELKYPGSYKIKQLQNPDPEFDPTRYYKDTGQSNQVTGDPYREYRRYTSWNTETSAEYLTMKGGSYKFKSDYNGKDENGEKDDSLNIDNAAIQGFYGKILVPKVTMKMTWHEVPVDFIDPTNDASVNIYQALGRVNQNPFWGFSPGDLLFTGFSNVIKNRNLFYQSDFFAAANIPALEDMLLCDITFNFLYIPVKSYKKELDAEGNYVLYPRKNDAYSPAGVFNENNLSYINAGHNLAPSQANKKYYPVVSNDLPGEKQPLPSQRLAPPYLSYPFELMFLAKPYRMGPDPEVPEV